MLQGSKRFLRLITMLSSNKVPLRGLVFDLDGTLTVPFFDFQRLKRQLKIDDNVDILGYVNTLNDQDRKDAMKIIEDFEAEGRDNLKLQPGLNELFSYVQEKTELKLALLTRNNTTGVEHFLSKCKEYGLKSVTKECFSVILTRTFKPVKPNPAPVLHIASQWNTAPENIIVIGDDKHDISCGKNAGSTTILVNNNKNGQTKSLADFNVDYLLDIIPIIKSFLINDEDQHDSKA